MKYAVIIQCDIAHNRCSGYQCTNTFYEKIDKFSGYEDGMRYISFTCGGCCGKGVSAKLEHLSKKFRKIDGISKDDVVIHMSSCMTTDNHHYDRCPHLEYIKDIVKKKGYTNIVDGTYISKNAAKKREKGIYTDYDK